MFLPGGIHQYKSFLVQNGCGWVGVWVCLCWFVFRRGGWGWFCFSVIVVVTFFVLSLIIVTDLVKAEI